MKHLCIAAAGVLLTATSALALSPESFSLSTGADLRAVCSVTTGDKDHAQAIGACLGFIEGVAQFHRTAVAAKRLQPIYCGTEGVTKAEAVRVYLAWADANPDFMSKSALEAALRAAANKWPCTK